MRIIQNPDTEYANEIKKKLKSNNGYCPCSIVKNCDTKCRCKRFRDQIERGELGACHCGLWIAVD
jgi:ferredoxin-thioredoxin reductase catalytic subunit